MCSYDISDDYFRWLFIRKTNICNDRNKFMTCYGLNLLESIFPSKIYGHIFTIELKMRYFDLVVDFY